MKILLYGDVLPGGGGWCYANTLRDMGHSVYEYSDWQGLEYYGTQLIWKAYRKLAHRVHERHRRAHVQGLLELTRSTLPEMILVLKGLHLSAEDVRALQRAGAWVANINHDDFYSQTPLNWSQVQRAAIPIYDFILTTREVNVREIELLNHNVEFFPFAYYPRIHRPVPIPPKERCKWEVDVVFIGTYAAHRSLLLEALVRRVPALYGIYGGSWHKLQHCSPLWPFVRQREIVLDEMAMAIGGAKIALGFLRKENRDDYTQRTFEIPACGGVLLAERTPRHQSYYFEGVQAEFFDPDDPGELSAKVQNLLLDSKRREAIRIAGRVALLSQRHTYEDRLNRLLNLYRQARSLPARVLHGRPF